jgi:predicted transcriptional regulator
MQIWNKQKKEMEDNVNVKMLQLTIDNKDMKWKLMEFSKLKKECMELRQKEESWIKGNHAYHKTLIKYKHKVEGLEREKQLWLQE